MRNLGALVLAVPVLVAVYLRSLVRRTLVVRMGAGIAAGAIIGLVVVASLPPARSAATPGSAKPEPVAAELLNAVGTGHPLTAPFVVSFAAPMDPASVAAALRLQPDGPISLDWDAAGTTLTIAPVGHWQASTLYTISVDAAARAVSGGTLQTPVRAVVLTGHGGAGTITATLPVGAQARPDTSFNIELDRPASNDAVRTALRRDPQIAGTVGPGATPGSFVFTPAAALAPATTYRIWLEGLVDSDGVPFEVTPALEVRTVDMPQVVRFRPRAGMTDVARDAAVSVRFTARMDRGMTEASVTVTAGGTAVAGKLSWAEKDTVLVFEPASVLPYGTSVSMTIGPGARSDAGVPLAAAVTGSFTTEPKPKPQPKPQPKPRPVPTPAKPKPITTGGGGAVSGSWTGVEAYYLKLMNCTRTGGWVTSSGACSSPGGRSVAPLVLSPGISSAVSRPYAKLLATRGLCDHFIGGNPGDRLRRAGYTSYRWAENLGCRSGDPYAAVLGSHLYFQNEKPYLGGHYVNLMNAEYDRAGIGVWVSGGRVRLTVDFYHP